MPEQGTVLVEFVIFLPILVFLMFASFEYSRVLRIHQAMAAIGREAAREAARECTGIVEIACETSVTTSTCLKGVFDRMDALMRSVSSPEIKLGAYFLEEISLVLSVYGQDPGDPSLIELSGIYPGDKLNDCDPDNPEFRSCCEQAETGAKFVTCSRFSDISFSENPDLRELVETKGSGVVAEVYAKYELLSISFLPATLLERLSKYYYVVVQ